MEVKKARRADLEKGKSRWLFMGLIVTLSFMFVSFEWTCLLYTSDIHPQSSRH